MGRLHARKLQNTIKATMIMGNNTPNDGLLFIYNNLAAIYRLKEEKQKALNSYNITIERIQTLDITTIIETFVQTGGLYCCCF